MAKLNFGIIACSSVARRRFVPALIRSRYAELHSIGSRDIEKGKKFGAAFGCIKCGTYSDVFKDRNVDAVYISTPINIKKDLVIDAILSHKHVIVEKPAFKDLDSAIEAINLSQEENVQLLEGWMFKYHPQHNVVKKQIEMGKIGKIKYFHGQFTYPKPRKGDIRLQPELCGGVFFDSAGYPIAASQMFIRERPISVFCNKEYLESEDIDDFVQIQIKFNNDIHVTGVTGFGLFYSSRYTIIGTKGEIIVERAYTVDEDMETKIRIETSDGKEELVIPPNNQFLLMIDDFSSRVLNEESLTEKYLEDIRNQSILMDAAKQSSQQDKLIII